MRYDTFTRHQKGTREVIGLLFGLYSRKIAALTVQDKVP